MELNLSSDITILQYSFTNLKYFEEVCVIVIFFNTSVSSVLEQDDLGVKQMCPPTLPTAVPLWQSETERIHSKKKHSTFSINFLFSSFQEPFFAIVLTCTLNITSFPLILFPGTMELYTQRSVLFRVAFILHVYFILQIFFIYVVCYFSLNMAHGSLSFSVPLIIPNVLIQVCPNFHWCI